MTKLISGLHHVTGIASDPQKNVDFYAGVLGLRLVKKTINFDAPDVYHLYYGNETGSPGTILTFFPFAGISKGRRGTGQITAISLSIHERSIDYWVKRLHRFYIKHEEPLLRFNDEQVITLEDPDGQLLELVANKSDERIGFTYGHIPAEHAIKGIYGITLSEECLEKTARLLIDQMDHQLIEEKENRFRYSSTNQPGGFIDILCQPDALKGIGGSGTIHHAAFAASNDAAQPDARAKLMEAGFNVTPIIDREYFHSIYFREPGGVLLEIATPLPGFSVDEPTAHLGESFKLPPWEEPNRAKIEEKLPPIKLNIKKFADR